MFHNPNNWWLQGAPPVTVIPLLARLRSEFTLDQVQKVCLILIRPIIYQPNNSHWFHWLCAVGAPASDAQNRFLVGCSG